MTAVHYTGTLRRGDTPDTVVGELVDRFGWHIYITGKRAIDNPGYVLQATVGEAPAALRISVIDDPADPPKPRTERPPAKPWVEVTHEDESNE